MNLRGEKFERGGSNTKWLTIPTKFFQGHGLAHGLFPEPAASCKRLCGAGHALLRQLRKGTRPGRIVITTARPPADEGMEFVKRGASGVVPKSAEPNVFVKSARMVANGEMWLPKGPASSAAPSIAEVAAPVRPADTLTRREKSIVSCLMQGWRNREIAQHLTITEQTVKNHLRTIYDKVGVSDRLELVLYAIHHRMELPPPPAAAA